LSTLEVMLFQVLGDPRRLDWDRFSNSWRCLSSPHSCCAVHLGQL